MEQVKDNIMDITIDQYYIDTMVNELTFEYARMGDSTTTICEAFLPNGFSVGTGKAACVDPAKFNFKEGCKYAKEDAIIKATNKIWELEGYLLKVTTFPDKLKVNNLPNLVVEYVLSLEKDITYLEKELKAYKASFEDIKKSMEM